jgi:serine/threonine protein kinase
MEDLYEISEGKYKILDEKINEGAYSKIYNVINTKTKNKKLIAKVQKISDKYEAINEIKLLLKLKKNKQIYFNKIKEYFINHQNSEYDLNEYLTTSKIIDIEDFYSNREYIFIIFKKYEYTLEDLNIIYNKEFKEVLPSNLTKKIINSLFLGIYELNLSNIIHCDIKPNNILIKTKNKNLKELFRDIRNNKVKKQDLVKYIDILYIDFNISQKCNSICKSTSIQTIYYIAPEIILGNQEFNYTIDFWSIGCIIYELIAGKYLFDIFGYNIKNGNNYINYQINKNNSISTNDSYSSYYDSYTNNDNIILLYMYRELFGDNLIIKGNKIKDYYIDNKLLGTIENKKIDNLILFEKYIKNNIIYNIDIDFYNNIIKLFSNIFIYDYNKRLTIEEYLNNFIF